MVYHTMMPGMPSWMGGFGFFAMIAVYVYVALALQTIAKKTNTENAWLAWIPIANMYLMTRIAEVDWWWFLVALGANFIPFIGWIAAIGIAIWWLWLIAERRGYPGWVAILAVIPIVNFVIIGLLAWRDQ